MATVHLPRSLVTLFGDAPPRHLDLEADSLADLVAELDARWPGMGDRLLETGPRIREHINVFVDGDQASLETPLRPDSTVHVIPAVSGG